MHSYSRAALSALPRRLCYRSFSYSRWSYTTPQGMWDRDSVLMQLPHFTPDLCKRCAEKDITTVFQLLEMEDEDRRELLQLR